MSAGLKPWRVTPSKPEWQVFTEPQNVFRPELCAQLTHDAIAAALLEAKWTFAKSMPQWPHSYTLRQNWSSSIPWENVVQFMRDAGRLGWFGRAKTPRMYWILGGEIFWTMGCHLDVTYVINRAADDRAPYYFIDRGDGAS